MTNGLAKSGQRHFYATPSAGAYLYQNVTNHQGVAIVPSPGESYTFSVWLRTQTYHQNKTGMIKVSSLGGNYEETGTAFSTYGGGVWYYFAVPFDVKYSGNTGFRVEIRFDNPSIPYDIDATSVYRNTMGNAGMEQANMPWNYPPQDTWTPYEANTFVQEYFGCTPICPPKDGAWFLEMVAGQVNGSIYQDIPITPVAGQSYYFTGWFRQRYAGECPNLVMVLYAAPSMDSQGSTFYPDDTQPCTGGVPGPWIQVTVSMDIPSTFTSGTKLRAQIYFLNSNQRVNMDATGSSVGR